LNTSVLATQLFLVVGGRYFLKDRPLPIFAGQPCAVIVGRSGYDFADLGVLWRGRTESLLLMLGIQESSHT